MNSRVKCELVKAKTVGNAQLIELMMWMQACFYRQIGVQEPVQDRPARGAKDKRSCHAGAAVDFSLV